MIFCYEVSVEGGKPKFFHTQAKSKDVADDLFHKWLKKSWVIASGTTQKLTEVPHIFSCYRLHGRHGKEIGLYLGTNNHEWLMEFVHANKE